MMIPSSTRILGSKLGYCGKYQFETLSFTHIINTCFKRVSNPWAHKEVFETARDMYDIIHF